MDTLKRTRRIILDHGGTLLSTDGPREGEDTERGLLMETHFCEDPHCHLAHLAVVDVTVAAAAVEGGEFKDLQEGILSEGPAHTFSIDIDTGEITNRISPEGQEPGPELIGRFKAFLDRVGDGFLELLRKRWRHAKDPKQEAWRQQDWAWYQPGMLVSWGDAFPDAPHLYFRTEAGKVWADDHYCITRTCPCRDLRLVIMREEERRTVALDELTVDLDRWTVSGDGGGPPSARQQDLWAEFQDRIPDLRETLAQRHKDLRRIAPGILALAPAASRAPLSRVASAPSPGRNDPCPCGSGRKYKKCCLRKATTAS